MTSSATSDRLIAPPTRDARKYLKLFLASLIAACFTANAEILWESRNEIAAGFGDFIIFYTGAEIINDGKAKELYKIDTQAAYQAKFPVPQADGPLPFNHAPYELLLFLPLTHLSYLAAHGVWSALNLIILALMVHRLLDYLQWCHGVFVAALIVSWFPTVEALRFGQDSIMSTLLLALVFLCLKQQRDRWAGFFLALGLYKPQLVLPLAGLMIASCRWQTLIGFSVTGALLAGLSILMVGWTGVFDLLSLLVSMQDHAYIVFPTNMPNLRGLARVLLSSKDLETIAGALTGGLSAGVYGLCLYFWRSNSDAARADFDLKFALALVATVLTSYHLYSHDLLPLAVAMTLFFRYLVLGSSAPPATIKAFFALLFVFFIPLLPHYLISSSILGWAAFPVLALYVLLAMETLRRQRLHFAA